MPAGGADEVVPEVRHAREGTSFPGTADSVVHRPARRALDQAALVLLEPDDDPPDEDDEDFEESDEDDDEDVDDFAESAEDDDDEESDFAAIVLVLDDRLSLR